MKVTALQLIREAKEALMCQQYPVARCKLIEGLELLELGINPGTPVEQRHVPRLVLKGQYKP